VLLANEIVTDVIIPPPAGMRSQIYEVRHREVFDWPMATAALAYKLDGKKVTAARLVLGHVAPVPWPVPSAAQMLVGKTISEELAEEVGKAALANAKPLSGNAYKVQLARVAVKRAIMQAAG
jgi:xanthine dehydrogenase YagS FAD-binding subunit